MSTTSRTRRPGALRLIYALQGACIGLLVATLCGIAGRWVSTPIPLMATFALYGAWIWPDRKVLAGRALVARLVVSNLAAVPFWWWPR